MRSKVLSDVRNIALTEISKFNYFKYMPFKFGSQAPKTDIH